MAAPPMSAYDLLPLWDGASPPPPAVPTSPFTVDRAGRWRVRGRFARREYISVLGELDFIIRRAYAGICVGLFPLVTPLLAQLRPAASGVQWGGNGVHWDVNAKAPA
jgi:hypothetical protein